MRVHYYSGKRSINFWKAINKLKTNKRRVDVYLLGCLLQDIEGRVLQILDHATNLTKKKKKSL